MLSSGRNAAKAFPQTAFGPRTRLAVIAGVLTLLTGAVAHTADQQERRPGVPGDREERRQGVPGDREERRQGVPGDREYPVRGMVLRVDPASRTMIVSHEKIAGLMDAMAMPFEVRDSKDLQGVAPGAVVDFTLVVGDAVAYATAIKVRRYESVEQDPVTARRLALLKRIAGMASWPLEVGGRVPNFTLTDQTGRAVSFADFSGKVVAVNFIYTRCALPQFCLRVTNNFGVVQKRFQRELGRDLVLLTITFDPERDTPQVLAKYADQWKADPSTWRFLTGDVNTVRRVCGLFGVDAFIDEGLINHTLRTAVIDRRGTLVASVEGNQYTPEQLGDLIRAALMN